MEEDLLYYDPQLMVVSKVAVGDSRGKSLCMYFHYFSHYVGKF